jgi:hypothetical protein
MSPSHHQLSIAIMSLHPYIVLKSHHHSIPRSRTSAFQARMFPRFARLCRLIHTPGHVTLASSAVHCHHEFTPLHRLEVTPSLDTAFAHFRFSSANIPALRAPMSPCSRAIDTSLSPHCNHLHIIQAIITIISPSCYCVCMHQSRFAQSATIPRFHAPMTPYACAFPAPSLHQSRLITFASDTLALCSSRITYPHCNFACSPLDALSGDTQNLSPQEM